MTDLVRVWIIPVDLPEATITSCADLLDDGERVRGAAFVKERDRQRFIVAHGVLRILTGQQLDAPAAALRWHHGPHGKPELPAPWSGLHTSLSHCTDLVAVAISTSRPVGVDIERLTPGRELILLSRRYFPPDEASYVAAGADATERASRFAQLWTRKEAVVKAAGSRLFPNLKIRVRDRAVVSCADPVGPYRVADVSAPDGFRAAVALAGPAPFLLRTDSWPGPSSER